MSSIFLNAMILFLGAVMIPSQLFSSSEAKLRFGDNNIYELHKIYQTQQSDVVMLGDSITCAVSWNELFNYPIINRGINGDTTSGFLQRLDEVLELKPKKVFIMGGINDIFQSYSVEEIFENHKKIIQKLQEHQITPYIQSTLYTAKKENGYNEKVKQLNHLLEQYCLENKIAFIDLNKKLSKDELLIQAYTHDGLHLKANAYAIWRDEIKHYIVNN
jgi:lysophospholipase L1-like esterase